MIIQNKKPWFLFLLIAYGGVFFVQEFNQRNHQLQLSDTLPASLQKIALGYFQQLGAEILYVKVVTFLGGRGSDSRQKTYASILGRHFQVIADLHPRFEDTYYVCESSIAWISPFFSRQANQVLTKGIMARPNLWVLPFFRGFNYFRYLEEPAKAASSLRLASKVDGAPGWVGHLATILAAEGGDIYGGRLWLKAMLAEENDEYVRSRYQSDLAEFEKALLVQEAIQRYYERYGRSPESLEDLQPDFIQQLPKFGDGYILSYKAPRLYLHRDQVR